MIIKRENETCFFGEHMNRPVVLWKDSLEKRESDIGQYEDGDCECIEWSDYTSYCVSRFMSRQNKLRAGIKAGLLHCGYTEVSLESVETLVEAVNDAQS